MSPTFRVVQKVVHLALDILVYSVFNICMY